MTFAIAGSAALRRTVKPKPRAWHCKTYGDTGECVAGSARTFGPKSEFVGYGAKLHPAYLSRCPDCGTRRPNT